jgi:serine/threonine-protein phosphatase 2A regulatory subunit B
MGALVPAQPARFGLSRSSASKRAALNGGAGAGSPGAEAGSSGGGGLPGGAGASQEFHAKLLHLAWHPEVNLVAAAASNSLYLYYAR